MFFFIYVSNNVRQGRKDGKAPNGALTTILIDTLRNIFNKYFNYAA